MKIRLVISGRSYNAASGVPETLELDDASRLSDALTAVAKILEENGRSLSDHCLVSLGSEHVGTIRNHEDRALSDGDELLLIAPVAGG